MHRAYGYSGYEEGVSLWVGPHPPGLWDSSVLFCLSSCLILNLVVIEVVVRGGRVDEIGELPVRKLEPQDGEEGVQ